MSYSPEYYDNEIREGFFIPGMIKRSYASQMDILKTVAEVCEKHNIKWYADCGTLIGAVRHHGFIPWDDDLDICMLQEDYTRFNQIAKDELPKEFCVINIQNEVEHENFLTRITNGRGINTGSQYLNEHNGFPYVAGIDIFPLHNLYDNEEQEKERQNRLKYLWDKISGFIGQRKVKASFTELSEIETSIGYKLDRNIPIVPALRRAMDNIFNECKDASVKKVALMPYYIEYQNHVYERSMFGEGIEMPFENTSIIVPDLYEDVLCVEYGAEWGRVNQAGGIHSYPFFNEQEELLKSKGDGSSLVFFGFENYVKEIVSSDEFNKEEQFGLENSNINLLEKIHLLFTKGIDASSICGLLEKAQQIAIKIGNAFESAYGLDNIVVKNIEGYCEEIYRQYVEVNSGKEVNHILLEKSLDELKISIDEIRKEKKLKIYMPYSHAGWKYMEKMYLDDISDNMTRAIIISIPLYFKDNTGNVIKKSDIYQNYPESAVVFKYDEFDFESIRADEIIIQYPYDEYNNASTIPSIFYSKNIKKFTDKLIYMPSFILDHMTDMHMKAKANVKYHAITPAVIYSDEIVLWSENIKENYLSEIRNILGNEWADKVERKTFVVSRYFEQKDNKNKDNKNILVYISFTNLKKNISGVLSKLNRIKEIFSGNKVQPVIYVDYDKEDFIKNDTLLYEEYCEVMDIIKSLGRVIGNEELGEAIDEADAYYGSPGYIMNMCVRRHIPVMQMNIDV